MSEKEFIVLFAPFCELFKTELSKSVITLYYENLKHLSVDEFANALNTVTKTRKYPTMPMIAEILEASEGDIDERMILARDELKYAMNRHGAYKSVCFKDKAIMAVVNNIGGWEAYGELSGKALDEFHEWRFPKLYKTYVKHPEKSPAYLPGNHEKEINFRGLEGKDLEIHFIGFDDKPNTMYLSDFHKELEKQSPLKISMQKMIKRVC